MSERRLSGQDCLITTDYVINVKTSDRFGAGTDANVFIQLFGDKGNSEPIQLKHSQKANKFERDQLDQFTFENEPSQGLLKSIKIWHDNAGLAAGWHLEFVEICDTGSGQKFRFPCHRWLSTDDDDGTICRDLRCFEVTAGPKHTVQKANGIPKKNSTSSTPDLLEPAGSGSNSPRQDIVPTKVIEVHSSKPSPTLTVYGPYHGFGSASPEIRKGSVGSNEISKSLYGKYSNKNHRDRSGSSHSVRSLNLNLGSLNIN